MLYVIRLVKGRYVEIALSISQASYHDQTRRFQIKFAFEHDYYKALALLSECGCSLSEPSSRLSSSQVPVSASSQSTLLDRQSEQTTNPSGMTELSCTFSEESIIFFSNIANYFSRQSLLLRRNLAVQG